MPQVSWHQRHRIFYPPKYPFFRLRPIFVKSRILPCAAPASLLRLANKKRRSFECPTLRKDLPFTTKPRPKSHAAPQSIRFATLFTPWRPATEQKKSSPPSSTFPPAKRSSVPC